MPILLIAVAALWSTANADFIKSSNEQLANGYTWQKISCRAPDESLPNIHITTPINNKYVCFKLDLNG